MSVEALTWALSVDVGDSTRKLVLLGFANHAHKDGTEAWIKSDTAAQYANCSKRTVQRHVKWLVENGYMREGNQAAVGRFRADHRPIVYDVAMNDDTVDDWKAIHVPGRREAAAISGARGGKAAAERGDKSAPRQSEAGTGAVGRGDKVSPGEWGQRGDTRDANGVTPVTQRGDTAMSPEPSKNHPREPSYTDDSLRSSSVAPTDDTGADHRSTVTGGPTDRQPESSADGASGTRTIGGRESKGRARRQLPDDFEVTQGMRAWAAAQLPGLDVDTETEQFRDHHRARGSAMKDWTAAWRTWMRNTRRFNGTQPGGRPQQGRANRHYAPGDSASRRLIRDAFERPVSEPG